MHNFDLILNYFCFARATEIQHFMIIREKYRDHVKIWGTLYIGVPHSKFWGTCPPVPPRFTPLAGLRLINECYELWEQLCSGLQADETDLSQSGSVLPTVG